MSDDRAVFPSWLIDEAQFWRDLDDALTPHELTDEIRYRITDLLDEFGLEDADLSIDVVPPLSVHPEWIETERNRIRMRGSDVGEIRRLVDTIQRLATELQNAIDHLNDIYLARWTGEERSDDDCGPPRVEGCDAHQLRTLARMCETDWEHDEWDLYTRILVTSGRPVNQRRVRLVLRVMYTLEASSIPLACSDEGVLANVLRVILAAADRIEGRPAQPRKYLKSRIAAWLAERNERAGI